MMPNMGHHSIEVGRAFPGAERSHVDVKTYRLQAKALEPNHSARDRGLQLMVGRSTRNRLEGSKR